MRRTTLTWIGLLVLTAISALLAMYNSTNVVGAILVLAAIKFMGVAFGFMELSKAHSFWKTITILFLILFVTILMYFIF